MPIEIIPSFLFFCFVNAITPGPANLCSLAAAMNCGRVQAFRQWRGLLTGFTIDAFFAVFVTWMVGTALNEYVYFLSWFGAAYILWLAFKILRSAFKSSFSSSDNANIKREDYTFISGLLLQLTNVKVILFCITALSAYVLPYVASSSSWDKFRSLFFIGLFLPFTGPVCNIVWIMAGVALQRLFKEHRLLVNLAMSISLVLCAWSLIA